MMFAEFRSLAYGATNDGLRVGAGSYTAGTAFRTFTDEQPDDTDNVWSAREVARQASGRSQHLDVTALDLRVGQINEIADLAACRCGLPECDDLSACSASPREHSVLSILEDPAA